MSFYRYLGNDKVREGALIEQAQSQCRGQVAGKDVLVLQDSTEINYASHQGLIQAESGLGLVGNNQDIGYFAHCSLVIDAQQGSVLGLSDVQLWIRAAGQEKPTAPLPIEKKETYRWIKACQASQPCLQQAREVTFVQDREGDIYDSFVRVPDERTHLLIRSRVNRLIETMQGEKHKLYDYADQQPACGGYSFLLPGLPGKRKQRNVEMQVRFVQVKLLRPDNNPHAKVYPKNVTLYLVQGKETPQSAGKEKPVEWNLLTTHPVSCFEQALQMVHWYSLRWIIEDYFRLLKSEGFNLEASELEQGYSLRKLGVIAMKSALLVMQLRQARSATSTQPIAVGFSVVQQAFLKVLLVGLEGQTAKHKNPYQESDLAWASWIIARLGGWKGYQSQRPPGVITFTRGLKRFESMLAGWLLAPDKDMYKH